MAITTSPIAMEMRRVHRFFDDFRGAYISSSWDKVGTPILELSSLFGVCQIDANEAIRFTDGAGNATEKFAVNRPLILFVRFRRQFSSNASWICLTNGDPVTATDGFGFKSVGGYWYGYSRVGGSESSLIMSAPSTMQCYIAEFHPSMYVRFWCGTYGTLDYKGYVTKFPTAALFPWCKSDQNGLKIDYFGVLEVVS